MKITNIETFIVGACWRPWIFVKVDIDDVPWKNELATAVPEISSGYMTIPRGPGWGADINEAVARAHPWDPEKVHNVKFSPPPRSF
jgi:hypothetical protein